MSNPTTITAEPGLPFVDVVREFDAPVSALYRAHTDPDLFARWTGPRGLTMEIHEFDASTGGRWQYVSTDPAGTAYGFRGVFHTVEPNTSIVQTFEYDGTPGEVSLGIARFEDLGNGRCRVMSRSVFPSVESRDGMVASGMEYGVREGYERLDELVTESDGAAVRAAG
jgi:uncharacterized protein YndB with AHSA1/START domain